MNKLVEWTNNAAGFIMALLIVLTKELALPFIFGLAAAIVVFSFILFLVNGDWFSMAATVIVSILVLTGLCWPNPK